jgi:hypothetical protein
VHERQRSLADHLWNEALVARLRVALPNRTRIGELRGEDLTLLLGHLDFLFLRGLSGREHGYSERVEFEFVRHDEPDLRSPAHVIEVKPAKPSNHWPMAVVVHVGVMDRLVAEDRWVIQHRNVQVSPNVIAPDIPDALFWLCVGIVTELILHRLTLRNM